MPLPQNVSEFLQRAEKGNTFVARIEGDKYLLYAKQYSPVDGTELKGQEQVQVLELAEIDAQIEALQARIDRLTALRSLLTDTALTAAEVNAARGKP